MSCPLPGVEHVELALLEVAPPTGQARRRVEMPAVDVEGADAAGSRVEVLVSAPEGEIDPPVVEPVRDGADRVGAVEADRDTALVGGGRQALDVQELTGAIEDRREEDEGGFVGHGGDEVVLVEGATVSARDEDEVGIGIAAAQPDLALERVDVGREIEGAGDDLPAASLWLVKGGDEIVEVDGR